MDRFRSRSVTGLVPGDFPSKIGPVRQFSVGRGDKRCAK